MEPENDSELIADIRDMLVRRYGEIVSGKARPVDGKEAIAYLRQRIESRRTGA